MRLALAIAILSLLCAASPTGVVKGFGISPRGFPLDYSQLPAFYTEVGAIPGGGVLWNGAWRDDVAGGTDAGVIPLAARSVLLNAPTYRYTPVLVFGWRSGEQVFLSVPGNPANDWTNAEAMNRFISMLSEVGATYKPPFAFLGNENDFYYESDPQDYANWIAFYNRAYDAIKAVSPTTSIGPVFNYEHMAGAGRLNGWTTSYWAALEMHDMARVDVVGITLYPWLSFATAAAVPADYLDSLSMRIGSKPIAITETGWPAENPGGLTLPWETNEPAQVTYLRQLSAMLAGKPVRMVNHLFLHAMQDPGGGSSDWKLFGSISIRDGSGNPRPVYDSWVAFLRNLRRRAVRH